MFQPSCGRPFNGSRPFAWAGVNHRPNGAQRGTARSNALACSDAIEALRGLASKRAAAAALARAAAATTARTYQQRADHTLGLQPSKPADLCASIQAMGDEWLQGRARP